MVRITRPVLLGALVFGAAAGCAHLVETKAINSFTAALDKGDLKGLKSSTSDKFEEKALRGDDPVDVLKILKLHPEEKITVVKVEDVSEKEKRVVVTAGKSKRKMQYCLVRDEKTHQWVVDDIKLKQSRKDIDAVKSVTDQMDLLLVVQDFLVAWHGGKKQEVLAVTTPEFGKLLAGLPAAHLERLTKKVAGERIRPEEFRPEAQINDKDAIVKLQRTKGILMLVMRQTKKGWKVGDVAVESRKDKEHLASAMKTATVIQTVVNFLKAYQKDDKQALKTLSAEGLYTECLKLFDLKMIALPAPDVLGSKDLVKTHRKGGEYVLQRPTETVKISLALASPEGGDAATASYVVDDVTIYDAKEEKRLAALYTAQARMQLFMRAILNGSLTLIRENSSEDLKTKVWSHLGRVPLAEILPPEIEMAPPIVVGKDFHGPVVRLHVRQGTRELSYVMRDYEGKVDVDDILMPVMDRPASLKETMQSLLPIRTLQLALREASLAADGHDRQIEALRAVCSRDFNRLVWKQVNQIPETAFMVLPHLDAGLMSITESPAGRTVVFGDARFGSRIDLIADRENWLVDRIFMLAGTENEPAELKHLLRLELAKKGPKGLALDPMSAQPIATNPSKTASADLGDAATVMPANAATPTAAPARDDPPVESNENDAPSRTPHATTSASPVPNSKGAAPSFRSFPRTELTAPILAVPTRPAQPAAGSGKNSEANSDW